MDRAQLGGAGYLDEIGRLLNPEIDILWTGPEIVSEDDSCRVDRTAVAATPPSARDLGQFVCQRL